MALINCPECGKEISDKATVCIHCGFPLQQNKCPECGKEISNKATVCIHCGFPLQQNNILEVNNNANFDEMIQYILDRANYFMANLDEYSRETLLYFMEVKPKLNELVIEAKRLGQMGDNSLWNKLAIAIANIDEQTAYYSGWGEHKKLFEFIDFSKISTETEKVILNVVLGSFEHKTLGDTRHIEYWYPIYELLLNGTEENKLILNNYLSGINLTKTQTKYDDVMKMVNENLGKPNLLPVKNSVNYVSINQNIAQNVPKCPTCQSANIKKISGLSKASSVAMWGIFSRKVHKQWHCNNCGSEW